MSSGRQIHVEAPSASVIRKSWSPTSSGRQIEAPSTSVIRKSPTWSPSKTTACSKVNTSLVDKEIEVLKERLELLEKQKSLAAKEQELEEMRKMSGSSCKLDLLTNSNFIFQTLCCIKTYIMKVEK